MKSRNRVQACRRVYLGQLLEEILELRKRAGLETAMFPIHFAITLQKAHLADRDYFYVKKTLTMMRDEAATTYRLRTAQWELLPFSWVPCSG